MAAVTSAFLLTDIKQQGNNLFRRANTRHACFEDEYINR
jgi:hypothetical protein